MTARDMMPLDQDRAPRSCGPSNDRFSPHLEEEGEETPQTEPPDYLVWSIK
jgi:hypothetical protein